MYNQKNLKPEYAHSIINPLIAIYIYTETYQKIYNEFGSKSDMILVNDIMKNEKLFNKMSTLYFSIDRFIEDGQNFINNWPTANLTRCISKECIENLFNYYNILLSNKNELRKNDIYVLDFSNFLKQHESLTILDALKIYINSNIAPTNVSDSYIDNIFDYSYNNSQKKLKRN